MEHEESPRQLLKRAVQAAAAGDRSQAYLLLRRAIMNDPLNETAWLWLVAVAKNPREARIALRQVEQLNPNHPKLPEARRWLETRLTTAPVITTAHPSSVEAASTLVEPALPHDVSSAQQPVPPTSDELHGVKPGVPSKADTAPHEAVARPKVTTRQRSWPKWVTILLILALIVALCLLAFAVWLRSSTARSAPAAAPDRDVQIGALRTALNVALSEARWVEAVSMLETVHRINPSDSIWQHSAANAYFQLSVLRRKEGKLPDALVALDQALRLAPNETSFLRERRLLRNMLEGLQLYHRGEWQAAIEAFSRVSAEDPTFAEVDGWLYSAYFNLGVALQNAGQLVEAQRAFQSALALRPDQPDAQHKVQEIATLLHPPTPTPSPTPTATPPPTATPTPSPEDQLILVDISEQRMYVYENGRLLWKWVVSTGEPGRDTATGRFRVLDKIEMAYASTWNLDMPYWLGIYYSGPLENGIHALPINRTTGVKLWEGLLGRRVSYGCVILSDENARTLFEWAQIGTPVVIQW
ncbi:MAG: L,D-transpeptidase family protein [Anaerolineae bacterium]|nr:L,D-transpeptidase family protein [Anaerolineae bacterium]MDW8071135.1 L,D-transpeptidase family protein [Anaerolineae bacterium]